MTFLSHLARHKTTYSHHKSGILATHPGVALLAQAVTMHALMAHVRSFMDLHSVAVMLHLSRPLQVFLVITVTRWYLRIAICCNFGLELLAFISSLAYLHTGGHNVSSLAHKTQENLQSLRWAPTGWRLGKAALSVPH